MTLNGDANFKGKLTCGLKNNLRNLVNFHASSRKSENQHFDGRLLSKVYKDLDEKVNKSCVSWHCRVMQGLKKNWFLVPKMTWRIWWILMRAVESLKICTLLGYFCRKYVIFERKIYKRVMSWKITFGFKNYIRNLVNCHTK